MGVVQVWHDDALSTSATLELQQMLSEMGTMEVTDSIDDLGSLPATTSKIQSLIANIPPSQYSKHAELLAKGTHRTIRDRQSRAALVEAESSRAELC